MSMESGLTKSAFEAVTLAYKRNDAAELRRLFAGGISPDLAGSVSSERPLHLAVSRRVPFSRVKAIFDAILDAGGSVDGVDKYGRTALYWAAEKDFGEACTYLAAKGANVDLQDWHGVSPLQEAARYGSQEAIDALLAAGADVKMCTSSGVTGLHEASIYDDIDTVRRLVSRGISPSFVPAIALPLDYLTPMQVAICHGSANTLRFYVQECGESLAQLTRNGFTSRELAVKDEARAVLLSLETELSVSGAFGSDGDICLPTRAPSPSL
jgi:hypothetical protein